MENHYPEITLEADISELSAFMDGLLSDLSNAPDEIRELSFNFLNLSPELVSLECGIAVGAVVPALFKPSQRLIDLGFAIRTGNFDLLLVERSHGFSFVDNRLVELPILSTLEKPTN